MNSSKFTTQSNTQNTINSLHWPMCFSQFHTPPTFPVVITILDFVFFSWFFLSFITQIVIPIDCFSLLCFWALYKWYYNLYSFLILGCLVLFLEHSSVFLSVVVARSLSLVYTIHSINIPQYICPALIGEQSFPVVVARF